MRNVVQNSNLIFFMVIFLAECSYTFDHRSKRFLLFPRRRSPIAMNIKSTLGVPIDLELESVIIGLQIQTKFALPTNSSQLWSNLADPFDLPGTGVGKRAIAKGEEKQKYNFAAKVMDRNRIGMGNDFYSEEDTNNVASMRWTVYKAFAEIAERYGFAGRSCVLRSICESAHTPFDYSSGILGELFHVVMSLSLTNEEIFNHEDNEYLYAEAIGKSGAPCEHIFRECKNSILDIFARIDSTI